MSEYIVQDTSLTAVADAIRAKTGGSSQLEFPNGFVSEVEKICSVDDIANGSKPSGDITINSNSMRNSAFYGYTSITSVSMPNITTIPSNAFYNVRTLQYINAPKCTTIQNSAFECSGKHEVAELSLNIGDVNNIGTYAFYRSNLNKIDFPNLTIVSGSSFRDCNHVKYVNLPKVTRVDGYGLAACQKTEYATTDTLSLPSLVNVGDQAFGWNTAIVKFDFGNGKQITTQCFCANTNMNILILRSTTLVTLKNINGFSSTPFESGGSGGTIYIPKSLYDHLGDGTSSDYQSATNWSTVDGYGTITWAKIEGSIYETQYADGTPISTT